MSGFKAAKPSFGPLPKGSFSFCSYSQIYNSSRGEPLIPQNIITILFFINIHLLYILRFRVEK